MANETTKKVPTDIRRATLFVRSMEESLKVYRDILGLEVWYDEQMEVTGVGLPAIVPQSTIRLCILKANDPLVGQLGLMEYLDPPLPPRDEYPKQLGIGNIVFVLNHSDVASIVEQLKVIEGVYIQSEPHISEYPAPDGTVYRRLGMSFFDQNGYFFEVNQLLS